MHLVSAEKPGASLSDHITACIIIEWRNPGLERCFSSCSFPRATRQRSRTEREISNPAENSGKTLFPTPRGNCCEYSGGKSLEKHIHLKGNFNFMPFCSFLFPLLQLRAQINQKCFPRFFLPWNKRIFQYLIIYLFIYVFLLLLSRWILIEIGRAGRSFRASRPASSLENGTWKFCEIPGNDSTRNKRAGKWKSTLTIILFVLCFWGFFPSSSGFFDGTSDREPWVGLFCAEGTSSTLSHGLSSSMKELFRRENRAVAAAKDIVSCAAFQDPSLKDSKGVHL